MAYVAGDYRFVVRGALASGETWANTWAFSGIDNPTERAAVATALHQFYDDINGILSNDWSALTCQSKNLFTTIITDETFSGLVGGTATDMMPGQIAVRLSLFSALGQNGGPFLCGFVNTDTENNGQLSSSSQSTIRDAASDFGDAIVAAGVTWGLDRPTAPEVVDVARFRVGRRFDVIRKRANDVGESYLTVEGPWVG